MMFCQQAAIINMKLKEPCCSQFARLWSVQQQQLGRQLLFETCLRAQWRVEEAAVEHSTARRCRRHNRACVLR